MLSADLVRARRRADKLVLTGLKGASLVEARSIAEELLDVTAASVGVSSEELDELLSAVPRAAKHHKLWAGLRKLVLDACEFQAPLSIDASEVRKAVFQEASARRAALEPGEAFNRDHIIGEVAGRLGVEPEAVEEGLFGDLKGAARLCKAPVMKADELLHRYELAQIQGVLLRASRLTATVHCSSPDAYRRLFSKLKFRQLLYRLRQLSGGGYEIEIEGPYSLFESVTKYGLQLSLVVPALLDCDRGTISAELRWGKERRALSFETSWKSSSGAGSDGPVLRSEVSALLESLQKRVSEFSVEVASELMNIPGVGLCVPDLKFTAPGREPVFLEVLGFWSREAVWKRVEWAQAGGHERVIFAASSRLRVKKEVLPDGCDASLYVYKGVMSAKAVLDLVDALA